MSRSNAWPFETYVGVVSAIALSVVPVVSLVLAFAVIRCTPGSVSPSRHVSPAMNAGTE